MDKDSPIINKEKHAIVISTIGNIGFLITFSFIGPLPGMTTKSTATLIGVRDIQNYLKVHIRNL